MIGESLEQHCLDQFNTFRAVAFPNAYFEKDNDARGGSKGDFIFREASQSGIEFISIMFEMKNEADTTVTKHKNEDFFQKLDKDRREKGCEYAVLVSMLEPDSELYNNGIVDVSHRYEKMYVIRPQFFIPILSLLRNAARNTLAIRQELLEAKHQQVDIENFQSNLNDFKDKFSRNFKLASQKFNTAIDEIDKAIARLSKVKEELLSSENQLRLANDKAEDLSIKKLAKNAPSLLEACGEAAAQKRSAKRSPTLPTTFRPQSVRLPLRLSRRPSRRNRPAVRRTLKQQSVLPSYDGRDDRERFAKPTKRRTACASPLLRKKGFPYKSKPLYKTVR